MTPDGVRLYLLSLHHVLTRAHWPDWYQLMEWHRICLRCRGGVS